MSRRPNIDRPVQLNVSLPSSIKDRLDILLYSEVERRVPYGAYNRFLMKLLTDHFASLKGPTDG